MSDDAGAFLLQAGKFLVDNVDIVRDVAEALAAGTPREALRAAIRGAMVRVSDDSIAEELRAAERRGKRFPGKGPQRG